MNAQLIKGGRLVYARGWCLVANGILQTDANDEPYFWKASDKEGAQEFAKEEFVDLDKPHLVAVEIRRINKRKLK